MTEKRQMFSGGVIVNSLPKSGTHLLERALMLLGVVNWHTSRSLSRRATDRLGITPPPFLARLAVERWRKVRLQPLQRERRGKNNIPIGVFSPDYMTSKAVAKWIAPRTNGSFVKAHIPYSPEMVKLMDSRPDLKAITIIREPRAVVASMIPYVLNAKEWKHFLQPHFEKMSDEERVEFVLAGGLADPPGIDVLSLKAAFESVLAWEQHAGTLVVRFEDLVGAQGGGSDEAQIATFEAIAAHLDVPVTDALRDKMGEVFDRSSPTFRGGQIDGWRTSMTPEQIVRVEAAIGPELFARAGYALD